MAINTGKFSKRHMKRNLSVGVSINRSASSKLNIVGDFLNVKRNYSSNLKHNFNMLLNGTVSKDEYVDLQKNIIESAFNNAFLLGKMYSQTSENTLTDTEKRMLRNMVTSEKEFMSRFADDVINNNGRMNYNKRLNMYVNSLVAVFTSGKMGYVPEDSIIYWKLGEADKHCLNCLSLANNSPYTKKSLPTVPKAGQTQCLSNCKCYLEYENNDEYLNFILKSAVVINGRNEVPNQQFYEIINSWQEDFYYYRGLYELTKDPKYKNYYNTLKTQIKTNIKFNNAAIRLSLPITNYINDLKLFNNNDNFELLGNINELNDNDIVSIHYNGKQFYGKIRKDSLGNIICKTLTGKQITLNLHKMIIFVERSN